jgi:hypothetical protein
MGASRLSDPSRPILSSLDETHDPLHVVGLVRIFQRQLVHGLRAADFTAMMDDPPFSSGQLNAHRMHDPAALSPAIAWKAVHVQAAQTLWTMIPATCCKRLHSTAADNAGKGFVDHREAPRLHPLSRSL